MWIMVSSIRIIIADVMAKFMRDDYFVFVIFIRDNFKYNIDSNTQTI